VIGQPVTHSLSPAIHHYFATQQQQALSYVRLPAALDGFEATARRFFAGGGLGLNVTLPFKPQAAGWVDWLDPAATAAAAVNTITRSDSGVLKGFNTDGLGLVRDLSQNLGWSLDGANLLLLGAGGAARGALRPLLDAGVAQITVANRTKLRAQQLVAEIAREDAGVCSLGLDELSGPFDLIVNASSASLVGEGQLVQAAVVARGRCYDMFYASARSAAAGSAAAGSAAASSAAASRETTGSKKTAFCAWAEQAGAVAVSDGFGMLIEQAAEAFLLWRGCRPDTRDLIAGRAQLFS
jgi:shikimate dehydrogenase